MDKISDIHPKIFESDLADVKNGRFFSKENVEFIQQYFTEHPLELGKTFEKGSEITLNNGEKLILKHRLIINEEGDIFACNRMDEKNLLGEGSYGKVGLAQNIVTGELVAFKEQAIEPNTARSDPYQHYRKNVNYALSELAIDAEQGLGIGTPIIEESDPHDYPSTKIISVMKLGTSTLKKVNNDYVMMKHMVGALWDLKTHFHDKNIIHRDIKGSNMMFVNGKLRLIDYGLSVRINRAIEVEAQEKNKEQSRIVREKDAKGRDLIFYRSSRYGWGKGSQDTKYDIWPRESQQAAFDLWAPQIKEVALGNLFSKSGDIYSMGQVFGHYMGLSQSFNDDIKALIDKMKDRDPLKRPTVEEALSEASWIVSKMEIAQGMTLTSKTVPPAPKVEADGSIKVKVTPSEKRKRLKNLVSTQRLKLELKRDLIKLHNVQDELVAATQGTSIVEKTDMILNFNFDPEIVEKFEKFRKLDPNSIVVKQFDFYITVLENFKKETKKQHEEYIGKLVTLTPGFDAKRSNTQDATKLREEQEIQPPRTSPPTSPRK